MKFIILLLVCMTALTVCALSQTPQADADPVLLETTNYKLPQSAIDAEIDGKVVMSIHVDETGKPSKAVLAGGLVWPCDKMPRNTLAEVSKTLSDTIMSLKFSPAIKDGKPVSTDLGLSFMLKNPKLDSGPPEIDPVTGRPIHRTIIGGNLNGKAKLLPKPAYPVEAKLARAGGAVLVQVLVDESGRVVRAGAVIGHPLLQLAARDSACGARYVPTTLEGRPVKVLGEIKYTFTPQ